MPTVHNADVLLSLETGSTAWTVPMQPGTDARWSTQTANYAWDFTLTEAQGRDQVQFRVPTQVVHPVHGPFNVTATHTIGGTTSSPWSASGSYLCSVPFASGSQLYIEVELTPVDEDLPLTEPLCVNLRRGGHYIVKTAGGPDPDGRRR
ncbi:hypothetical protein K7C98_12480 [Nannocystis pusilla]|uniref:Uncharacterized protein n=1 Tax=Nannocystis pusilla TaxID=889268 RepID=A0ABS7TPK3_9BACT|nr:hypothetical protein [Nannocystis pusilla]